MDRSGNGQVIEMHARVRPKASLRPLISSDGVQAMDASPAMVHIPQHINAVDVRDLVFSYGRGQSAVHALKTINLTVPTGAIYGLLGPSGCGKTTLLRCIIGRVRPSSGTVTIFGHKAGEPGSGVPGPRIGYMPQEIALFDDFTISETLQYFGRIYSMSQAHIKQRTATLLCFLQLESMGDRLIGNLSGGQKRRVSLAASLIHKPPLLILDEPTVGVDPVLREAIWSHLVKLSREEGLTVIITTHYIEEARAANCVGLTRNGKLLVQASPALLLARFGSPTLEDVFLKLCLTDDLSEFNEADSVASDIQNVLTSNAKVDGVSDSGVSSSKSSSSSSVHHQNERPQTASGGGGGIEATPPRSAPISVSTVANAIVSLDESAPVTETGLNISKIEAVKESFKRSNARVGTMCWKNYIRLKRNLPVLMFQFLLPSIEIILFAIAIGGDPMNLPLSIVNMDETGDYAANFLKSLDPVTLIQVPVNDTETALQSVRDGSTWGVLIFAQNFSLSLQDRVMEGGYATREMLNMSNIHLKLDMSNYLISLKIQSEIMESFSLFAQTAMAELGLEKDAAQLPVIIDEPIYGVRKGTFTEFMAPGVLLSICFLAAVALTALALVIERKEGLMERSLVAGVSPAEFLLGHVYTQLVVLTVQVALLIVFTFGVFAIPVRGPFFWVVVIILLQATCGMTFGLLISAITTNEISATMLALGSFYPNLLLSGTVWPTQAMPSAVRTFSFFLPQTLAIESLRHVLARGWGVLETEVLLGFAITIGWSLVFLISAILIFRSKA